MEPRDCGDSSSLVSKDNGQGDMVLPVVWGCTACTPSIGRRGAETRGCLWDKQMLQARNWNGRRWPERLGMPIISQSLSPSRHAGLG
jgi:hypothetical protein